MKQANSPTRNQVSTTPKIANRFVGVSGQAVSVSRGDLLWYVTLFSMFIPAVSPVFWGAVRPPLAYFMLAAWIFKLQQVKITGQEVLLVLFAFCATGSFLLNMEAAKFSTYLTYLFFVYGVLILRTIQSNFSNHQFQSTLRFLVLCGVLNGVLGITESYSQTVYSGFRAMTNASFYMHTTNLGGWINDNSIVRSAVLCVEPGFYAGIQALVLPLCFTVTLTKRDSRYFWYRRIAPVIILVSIYLSFGRTGWLAIIGGPFVVFLVYAAYKIGFSRQFLIRVTVTCLLFVVAISPYFIQSSRDYMLHNYIWNSDLDLSIRSRLYSMAEGIRIAFEHPYGGVGPGITGQYYSDSFYGDDPPPSVLNLFINIAAEVGIPAFICFTTYLTSCFFSIPKIVVKYKNKNYHMLHFSFIFLVFIWCMMPDLRMVMFIYVVASSSCQSSQESGATILQPVLVTPKPKTHAIRNNIPYNA